MALTLSPRIAELNLPNQLRNGNPRLAVLTELEANVESCTGLTVGHLRYQRHR
jgi:hypothetical protein